MSSKLEKGILANLRYDFPASIIVFLVAMPLCLGIAMASGVPLFSGIISGIIGGIIVALLSGSPLGVSGPAAGLTAIVLSALQQLGSLETFLLAVVIAGVFQVVLGFAKAGVIGYFFPTSIIKGMLAGIGVIIILKQLPHFIGGSEALPEEGVFSLMSDIGFSNGIASILYSINPGVIIIAAVSMFILLLWEQSFMKKIVLFKYIQGPLVVVVLGIVFSVLFGDNPEYALSTTQLVSLPVPDSIQGFFQQFTFPDFSQLGNGDVYVVAITIAIVASLETLLSVEASDKLDPQKRVTDTNRELFAQGIGNMVSGLIGGLPLTQVVVRSSANVQSGGRTKMSAILHGVLLLVSAMAIPSLLNLIPLSSLAAILVVVGFKLAKPSVFVEMYKRGKSQFVPFVVTVAGILVFDLLVGIGLGLVFAMFHLLWNNFKAPYSFVPEQNQEKSVFVFHLAEHVSFLNKAAIQQTLNHIPENSTVIIDATKNKTIHFDVVEIFEDFKQHAVTMNTTVEIRESILFGAISSANDFQKEVSKRRA